MEINNSKIVVKLSEEDVKALELIRDELIFNDSIGALISDIVEYYHNHDYNLCCNLNAFKTFALEIPRENT